MKEVLLVAILECREFRHVTIRHFSVWWKLKLEWQQWKKKGNRSIQISVARTLLSLLNEKRKFCIWQETTKPLDVCMQVSTAISWILRGAAWHEHRNKAASRRPQQSCGLQDRARNSASAAWSSCKSPVHPMLGLLEGRLCCCFLLLHLCSSPSSSIFVPKRTALIRRGEIDGAKIAGSDGTAQRRRLQLKCRPFSAPSKFLQ